VVCVAYTTTEGREQLLSALAEATDEAGATLAFVGAAYEQLDDQSADRLEEELFGPAQRAYGRAKRTHAEFAQRHGLAARSFAPPALPPSSLKANELIESAAASAERVDETLAKLQDDQALVEVGDVELRSGVASVREAIGSVPLSAREFLRTLGR
jgi:hypothetical protein